MQNEQVFSTVIIDNLRIHPYKNFIRGVPEAEMKYIGQHAGHITLAMLISVLLAGSWFAGETSRSGGQTDTILGITFALLIPCAVFALYLQGRTEIED